MRKGLRNAIEHGLPHCNEMITVREPIVEGIFYPSDRKKLHALMEFLFESARGEGGTAWGVLSPHAGYRYSGVVAAEAFTAACRRPVKTAVILAPLHRSEKAEVILPESGKYRIPFGLIDVDRAAVDELAGYSTRFIKDDIPHLEEHGIEVQLPFLHFLFPQAKIVPVLMGNIGRKTVIALARALEHMFDKDCTSTLFVVSANLTSFTHGDKAHTEAETVLRFVLAGDADGLLTAFERGTLTSCGVPSLAALLCLAGPAADIRLLASGNSAQVNRDDYKLAHYAAVGFFGRKA